MKKTLILFAIATLCTAGSAFALDPPQQARANEKKQQQGQREIKGKRTGPQDGTGPIHAPGTGGGSGAGNRRGRK